MYQKKFKETDPEFAEFFQKFAYEEVVTEETVQLDSRIRYMAILATLLGCQGTDLYEDILSEALESGLTPVEVKEIVYQAVAYLGIGRIYPFLKITNTVFAANHIQMPLEGQATTTVADRVEKGNQTQVDIFGERFKGFLTSGPEEKRHINRWLAGNCFGDYYTRNGLDLKEREMITFCFLSAQGTEVQLKGHIAGNVAVGNDKQFLIRVASQCMPYIGYPRTLNALRCIAEVLDNQR